MTNKILLMEGLEGVMDSWNRLASELNSNRLICKEGIKTADLVPNRLLLCRWTFPIESLISSKRTT